MLAGSAFDTAWIAQVDHHEATPMLFVAGALLLYFDEDQVKSLVLALQRRFPAAELVCDVCTRFAARMDNLHLRFSRSAARIRWGLREPRDVEAWAAGIRLLASFSYFDDPEPRMGFPSWFGNIPSLSRATSIQRYVHGGAPRAARCGEEGNP